MSLLGSPAQPPLSSPIAQLVSQASKQPHQPGDVKGKAVSAPDRPAPLKAPGLAGITGPVQRTPRKVTADTVASKVERFQPGSPKYDVRHAALVGYITSLASLLPGGLQQAADEMEKVADLHDGSMLLPGAEGQPRIDKIVDRLLTKPETVTDSERHVLMVFQQKLADRTKDAVKPNHMPAGPFSWLGVKPSADGPHVSVNYDSSKRISPLPDLVSHAVPSDPSNGPSPKGPDITVELHPDDQVSISAEDTPENRTALRTLKPSGTKPPIEWVPVHPEEKDDLSTESAGTILHAHADHPALKPGNHVVLEVEGTNPKELQALAAWLRDRGIDVRQSSIMPPHTKFNDREEDPEHAQELVLDLGPHTTAETVQRIWDFVHSSNAGGRAPQITPSAYLHSSRLAPKGTSVSHQHLSTDPIGRLALRPEAEPTEHSVPVWGGK